MDMDMDTVTEESIFGPSESPDDAESSDDVQTQTQSHDDDNDTPIDGQSQTYAPIVTSNPTETPAGDDWTNIPEPVVDDLTSSYQTNTPQPVDTHSKITN